MIRLRNVLEIDPLTGRRTERDVILDSANGSTYEMDLHGHAVLPALLNAHDHLQLNGLPPLERECFFRNSYEWAAASRAYFAVRAVRAALSVPASVRHWHGGLKNALCGAITVAHHDLPDGAFDDPSYPVRVLRPYGWAHSLRPPYGPPVAESFRATPSHVPWFIRLAEGVDHEASGELEELAELGCLRSNTVLIHGIGLGDSDIARVVEAGASVVWCPSSNVSMFGRTLAPRRLRALFDAGRLALGTDSRLTGARDLLEELRVAFAYSDFSPAELLRLVTADARHVLRTPAAGNDILIARESAVDRRVALLTLRRSELRAVVRDAEPVVADPDFEEWFVHRNVAFVRMTLDGRPKLCARKMLSPGRALPWALESGLTP